MTPSPTHPRRPSISALAIGLLALGMVGCTASQTGPSTQAQAAPVQGGTAFFEQNGRRCIQTDNVPDHSVGTFPNPGNPHSLRAQNETLCVPLNPSKGRAKAVRSSMGVAVNGVQIRPGTADYYDASSRRGHSRDPRSGWNLEGKGAAELLGLDQNDAHVDERGLYHYHGLSAALRRLAQGTLIGYAADGFAIHYDPTQRSSYRLKSGTRPSGPGGRYDGTYVEDWQYVAGAGTLDACNGGTRNSQFVYYATTTYPFFPRCLYGTVSSDFR